MGSAGPGRVGDPDAASATARAQRGPLSRVGVWVSLEVGASGRALPAGHTWMGVESLRPQASSPTAASPAA